MDLQEGVELAIKKARGISRLADLLGVRPQAIQQWKRVPKLRVYQIEERLKIPRHLLRPDLFTRLP